MIARIGLIAAVLASIVVVGLPWNSGTSAFQPSPVAAAPAEGPAASWTNGLVFSSSLNSNGQPSEPRVEFGRGTHSVWASFELRDHDPNAEVSYIVRANGEDYRFGTLDCCNASSGWFAFPIRKRTGNGNLPGAAYEVRLYVNGAEVAVGGFGVKGGRGLDNDND